MVDPSERFGDTGIIELTGKIMVVAIVLLLFIVVFVFCLHLYAKYFWYRRRENTTSSSVPLRRRRFDFAAGHQEVAVSRRGLEPSVLKTLPVIIFDPKEFKDGLECAICLSEISHGEETRVLHKCSHGFHLDCIDMWFDSHSTCPLCRNPIKNPDRPESGNFPPSDSVTIQIPAVDNSGDGNNFPTEAPNFPTNVMIWGDETQVSTFSPSVEENSHNNIVLEQQLTSSSSVGSTSGSIDGISMVEIARRLNEEDEQKSLMPAGLRSLKGLLSYNNRRVNPSSSRDSDIEQGGR